MATTTNITTTYSGSFAGKYVAAALLPAPTIANNLITVKQNVKYKEVLKRVGIDDIVKDGSCDFDPTSTLTLTERILEPRDLQINLSLCKSDFRSDWEAIEMGYSAFDNLPKNFSDFLIAHVAEKSAARNELSIWQGVAPIPGGGGFSGQFDGFETLLALDPELPAAQEVAGTTVDATNVVAQLGLIIDAMPDTLYGREDLRLYVSNNIFKAYVRALGGYGAAGLGSNGFEGKGNMWYTTGGALYFDGIPVVMCPGMSANTAILSTIDNLYFGTGLLSDHQEVKVLDMADLDGSQNVRVIMRFTAAVNYAFAADVVTYGIVNSAN
jgi:hypothetical protein